MTCKISRFQDGGSLKNYISIFLSGRKLKNAYIS